MTKSFDKYMGEVLRNMRKDKGYTQFEVSQKMGKNNYWCKDVETGKQRVYYEDMIKLCEIYETNLDTMYRLSVGALNDEEV